MRKRNGLILAAVLALAVLAGVALLARRKPPEAARLLPAADAYVYLDLKTLRRAGAFDKIGRVVLEPEYDQFVRETGFQFERDLDEAGFAVHVPSSASFGQGPPETRYSEVFTGNFDRGKISAYLKKLGATTQRYRNVEIYAVSLPGRTARVAMLSDHMAAASNTEGPYVLQGIIDRHAELTSAFSSPDLLRQHYRELPLGSVAWVIARTGGESGRNTSFLLPGGYNLFVPSETDITAAVRYAGAVEFRASAMARTEEGARRLGDQVSALVAVTRALETNPQTGSSDAEVKAFFDSIAVTQSGRRAELRAIITPGLMKKLVAEAPSLPGGAAAPAEQKPKKKPRVPRRESRVPSP